MKRIRPVLDNTDSRTRLHSNRIRTMLDSAGGYTDMDEHAVALLGSLLTEFESLPCLDLTDSERLSARIRLSAAIVTVRRSLGMTKAEQLKAEASRRGGGRPTKSETDWADLDV